MAERHRQPSPPDVAEPERQLGAGRGGAARAGAGADAVVRQAAALQSRSEDLDARELLLAEREARLDARAAEPQASAPPTVWSLPAAPADPQINKQIVENRDDLPTVARGIGIDADWAAGVLTGVITDVDIEHVQRLCEGLHCTPYDMFGAKAGRSIAHVYGPELWPRYIEPLEPLGWSLEDVLDVSDLGPDGGL